MRTRRSSRPASISTRALATPRAGGRASAGSVSTMSAVAKAGGWISTWWLTPTSPWTRVSSRHPCCRAAMRNAFASARQGDARRLAAGKTAWLTKPYFKAPEGQAADYRVTPSSRTSRPTASSISPSRTVGNCWPRDGDAAADQFIAAVRLAARNTGWPISAGGHPRPDARLDQVEAFKELASFPRSSDAHLLLGDCTATRCWAPSGPSTSPPPAGRSSGA